MLSFSDTWLPYVYLYGIGGIFFITGIILVYRSRAMNFKFRRHRHWMKILIFGFLWYMAIHLGLILAALYG